MLYKKKKQTTEEQPQMPQQPQQFIEQEFNLPPPQPQVQQPVMQPMVQQIQQPVVQQNNPRSLAVSVANQINNEADLQKFMQHLDVLLGKKLRLIKLMEDLNELGL